MDLTILFWGAGGGFCAQGSASAAPGGGEGGDAGGAESEPAQGPGDAAGETGTPLLLMVFPVSLKDKSAILAKGFVEI